MVFVEISIGDEVLTQHYKESAPQSDFSVSSAAAARCFGAPSSLGNGCCRLATT